MEVLKKSIPSKYISYFARHNTAANLIFVLMIVLGLFAVNNICLLYTSDAADDP